VYLRPIYEKVADVDNPLVPCSVGNGLDPPESPEQGQAQVTQPWVAQNTPLGCCRIHGEDKDYLPGFGLAELIAGAGLLMPPWDNHLLIDNDASTARYLENFTKQVLWKNASSLIYKLPKPPSSAKAVLLLWSKRLAAHSLSGVCLQAR
jgi:hypothetical protein